jgi:hypothetical protein
LCNVSANFDLTGIDVGTDLSTSGTLRRSRQFPPFIVQKSRCSNVAYCKPRPKDQGRAVHHFQTFARRARLFCPAGADLPMVLLGIVFSLAIRIVELQCQLMPRRVLPGRSFRLVVILGASLRGEKMLRLSRMAHGHGPTAINFAIQSGLQPHYNESSRKPLIVPLP